MWLKVIRGDAVGEDAVAACVSSEPQRSSGRVAGGAGEEAPCGDARWTKHGLKALFADMFAG